ncbi:sulfite exporter TauE/SafE family protein [bacterium]|nr:sulfite exporter TauE/SafE family protein [bacterium]|tara:strand:- start:123067 stop:123417 length:351 start_codon:yes stop_codon:yes gene_type:complete
MIIYLIIGIIGGFLSGFMGIGGGIIMVPFMVLFAGFSQHLAQGTSLAVLSIPIVIFGAYQYYLQGNVNVKAALVIALFFSIGIYFGSKYAQSINPETLKIIFGFMIILIGIKMVAA